MNSTTMTMQSKSARSRTYQSAGSHPYEHKLKLRSTSTAYVPGLNPERSLTVTNVQIAPRTTFEMERPQSQSSPRLVVINTSFRTPYQDRSINSRRRVPTFPQLATDSQTHRNILRPKTNLSYSCSTRQQSGNSHSNTRDVNSASNRLSANMNRGYREVSAQSDRRTGSAMGQLTQRQSNTFAQYAKYNDYVNSTLKARENASKGTITGTINDLSALHVVSKPLQPSVMLSTEKQLWIADWIESTSAALRLHQPKDEDSEMGFKPMSVIEEY